MKSLMQVEKMVVDLLSPSSTSTGPTMSVLFCHLKATFSAQQQIMN
jgi:hypothetical protein